MAEKIVELPGDGIGPEVTEAAKAVLQAVGDFEFIPGLIGGCSIDETGEPLTADTLKLCREVGAVLLGAVGGPQWETDDIDAVGPEQGLVGLRRGMETNINVRPVQAIESISDKPALKINRLKGVDLVIVRELLRGEYCGEGGEDDRGTFDVVRYEPEDIIPAARFAFDLALTRAETSGRDPHVTSVDKRNIWRTSRLWRRVVNEVHEDYPDVQLDHMLVDNANYQIGQRPRQFDVLVTSNMFGDILSDGAANVAGSLGLLPSVSLSAPDKEDRVKAIAEPIHGSAPDIAGQGIANPVGAIFSAALLLRHRFDMPQAADRIEAAVHDNLAEGCRTRDLRDVGAAAGTEAFTDRVLEKLAQTA